MTTPTPYVWTDPFALSPNDAANLSAIDPRLTVMMELARAKSLGRRLTPVEEAILANPEFRSSMAAYGQMMMSAEKIKQLEREVAETEKHQTHLLGKIIDNIDNFMTEAGPVALHKPQGSRAHMIAEWLDSEDAPRFEPVVAVVKAFGPFTPMPFLIEHDWAAAFAGAKDFDEGDIRLPYDSVLFEFSIAGRPVCVFASGEARVAFIRLKTTWVAVGMDATGTKDDLFSLLRAQIRAICIALDAEVAITDTVRAPEKLNRARAKRGAPPLSDYHVIRLNRRERAAPLPSSNEREPGTRHRLHFVRGHWRHYESHKTWIKWHLRGDPDLGYIDKHYRL